MTPFNQIPMEAIILYGKSLEMSGRGNYESALNYLINDDSTSVQQSVKWDTVMKNVGGFLRQYQNLIWFLGSFQPMLKQR